jgi:drug/metabolite transporter superfamily protein YnfA
LTFITALLQPHLATVSQNGRTKRQNLSTWKHTNTHAHRNQNKTSCGISRNLAHWNILFYFQFDTSQIIVGTVFLGHAGVYALASLGLSWMTDRTSRNVLHLFVLSGATISLVGYCFIGPLPFIPIEQ